MRRIFLILLFPLCVQAVEYHFDLGEITATGEVTHFPAGLGWISENQFSASAIALENRSYQFKNELLNSEANPLSLRPISIGSGMGRSWGGWSLLVSTSDQVYSGKIENAVQSSDSVLRINRLSGQLGCGLRLSSSWAIGWSLGLAQSNSDSTTIQALQPLALVAQRQQTKTQTYQVGMGSTFRGDLVTLGFHFLTPNWVLSSSGKTRTQSLLAATDLLTDTNEDTRALPGAVWSGEVGLRFGHQGFIYMFSDDYQFNGQHTLKAGFEYAASWGTIATGVLDSRFGSTALQKLRVGFAWKKGNFHWAIGPSIERESSNSLAETETRSYSVLYSSEISY